MPRRTAEASKAVRLAWQREQELVQEGKGTRDWTPDQQRDILKKGKAYNNDGITFEGHHMKSVEQYPEYQGEPNNIQFLTKSEHLAAHNGFFKNSTNGYYDPLTGKNKDFGLNKYEPCKIIELSSPISISIKTVNNDTNNSKQNKTSSDKRNIRNLFSSATKGTDTSKPTNVNKEKIKFIKKWFKSKGKAIGIVVASIGIPLLIKFVDTIGKNSNSNKDNTSNKDNYEPFVNNNSNSDYEDDISSHYDSLDNINDFEKDTNNNSTKGIPKRPHPRREYLGHRWKKNDNGELELSETHISETFIHKEQINNDSK